MVIRLIHQEVANRNEIKHFDIAAERPALYPSKWFENNPGQKPTITIMKVTDEIRMNLHQTIITNFHQGTLSPTVATTFLMDEFTRKSMRHDDRWESFRTVITEGGVNITVADIVRVDDSEPTARRTPSRCSTDGTNSNETLHYRTMSCIPTGQL